MVEKSQTLKRSYPAKIHASKNKNSYFSTRKLPVIKSVICYIIKYRRLLSVRVE